MDSRVGKLLIFALIALMVSANVASAAFSPNNFQNITSYVINNWTFKLSYQHGAYNRTEGTTNYALIPVTLPLNRSQSSISSPADMDIQGYSISGASLGNVSGSIVALDYGVVNANSVTSQVLIRRTTDAGQPWAYVTIYSNVLIPTPTDVCQASQPKPPCPPFATFIGFPGNFALIPSNLSITLGSGIWNQTQAAVIVADAPAFSGILNISFAADTSHAVQFFTNNALDRYVLDYPGYIIGVAPNPLTGSSLFSDTANQIYGGIMTNNGFSAYLSLTTCPSSNRFSTICNQDVNDYFQSEGLGANLTDIPNIHNLSTGSPTGLAIFSNTNVGTLSIVSKPLSNEVLFSILPAFTSNYSIKGQMKNVNASLNLTSLTCPGWYGDFLNRYQVYDVNWTLNFTTLAQPSYLDTPYGYLFGQGGVGFAKITLPASPGLMGAGCINVYLRAYNASTKTDYGAVPFTLLNCSYSTGTMTLLIHNTTTFGDTLIGARDNFYVYFNSQNNTQSYSSPSVNNNWHVPLGYWNPVTNPTMAVNTIPDSDIPYMFLIPNGGLAAKSFIQFAQSQFGGGGNYSGGAYAKLEGFYPLAVNVIDPNIGNYNTRESEVLITTNSINGLHELITGGLTAIPAFNAIYSTSYILSNITTSTGWVEAHGSQTWFNFTSTTPTPQAVYLFTTKAQVGYQQSQSCAQSNTTVPLPPFNVTNATKINTTRVVGLSPFFPNVQLPAILIYLIALVCLIIVAAFLQKKDNLDDMPLIVLAFIAMFIFGFFIFGGIIVLVAVLIILFLLLERRYLHGR